MDTTIETLQGMAHVSGLVLAIVFIIFGLFLVIGCISILIRGIVSGF